MSSFIIDNGHFFLNIKPHTAEVGQYKNQIHPYVNELVFRMQVEWGWKLIDQYCWPHSVPPRRVVKKFRNSWEPIYWFTKDTDFVWYPEAVKGTTDTAVITREKSWGKWSNLQGSKTYYVPRGEKGESYPSNVLYLGRTVDSRHPAQFPSMLPTFFMTACSIEGEYWMDPFCGSGTTLFAAEEIGRVGYGIERDPRFVSLILEKAKEADLEIRKVSNNG
jgi:DNA modification methylase